MASILGTGTGTILRPTRKKDLLHRSLEKFYENEIYREQFKKMISGQGPVSLRLMEWFATNFCKKYNVSFFIGQSDNLRCFNVYLDYKSQLKAYNKKQFDPFCRHERTTIQCGTEEIETTIGQANFFRWVLQNQILEYAVEHSDEIEADMSSASRHSHETEDTEILETSRGSGRRKRRGEINRSATRRMTKTTGKVTLSFS
jgi:hypothetical protein